MEYSVLNGGTHPVESKCGETSDCVPLVLLHVVRGDLRQPNPHYSAWPVVLHKGRPAACSFFGKGYWTCFIYTP